MDYRRVCAVDAGTRNFAFCVCDNTTWRKPLVWRKEDLWAPEVGRRGKPTLNDVVDITVAWCNRNRELLDSCDVIVLENQMRKPFIVMNTVIHGLFHSKTKSVHPMTVGSYFGLPKTREPKKKATVELCRRYAFIPEDGSKPDDLADAWQMCIWELVQSKALSAKYFSELEGRK